MGSFRSPQWTFLDDLLSLGHFAKVDPKTGLRRRTVHGRHFLCENVTWRKRCVHSCAGPHKLHWFPVATFSPILLDWGIIVLKWLFVVLEPGPPWSWALLIGRSHLFEFRLTDLSATSVFCLPWLLRVSADQWRFGFLFALLPICPNPPRTKTSAEAHGWRGAPNPADLQKPARSGSSARAALVKQSGQVQICVLFTSIVSF